MMGCHYQQDNIYHSKSTVQITVGKLNSFYDLEHCTTNYMVSVSSPCLSWLFDSLRTEKRSLREDELKHKKQTSELSCLSSLFFLPLCLVLKLLSISPSSRLFLSNQRELFSLLLICKDNLHYLKILPLQILVLPVNI